MKMKEAKWLMNSCNWLTLALISMLSVSSFGYTIEILGPSEWIHLGDSSIASWPDSVGITWTTIFDLSGPATEDATLSFKHIESDPQNNNVFINGVLVDTLTHSDGTITRDPFNPANWVDQEIFIPLALLTAGTNTLHIECGVSFPGSSFPYDDFMLTDMTVTVVPEPTAPPVADADGPYVIYVGETVTLDGSRSTDADDDIVSFIWDLDDDESFETDAAGQAIFDVNYTYLQSLGLLVNNTYTIHLKVTDSEGQSDVNDSTLTIVPKPALEVAVDIKPGSCPNPVNVKSKGVLPVAILGSADFDVHDIDVATIQLAGVDPLRSGLEDVAAPVSDSNDCNCITDGPDGFLDLTLKFKTQRIVEAIGDVNDGDELVLELTGLLHDDTPITGADCIIIRAKGQK